MINIIDSILNICNIPVNTFTREYIVRSLPIESSFIFDIMDDMIKDMGGIEHCMQFEISYKFKKQYYSPTSYKGIPVKSTPSTTKKIIILKPFLL